MLRGHTPKKYSESQKKVFNTIRESFGDDFAAKLKSETRHEFRDYRKTEGKGDASFRRYLAKKMAYKMPTLATSDKVKANAEKGEKPVTGKKEYKYGDNGEYGPKAMKQFIKKRAWLMKQPD